MPISEISELKIRVVPGRVLEFALCSLFLFYKYKSPISSFINLTKYVDKQGNFNLLIYYVLLASCSFDRLYLIVICTWL